MIDKIKKLIKDYQVSVSVVGTALVVSASFFTCSVEPPILQEKEDAPVEEPIPESEDEKSEDPEPKELPTNDDQKLEE